MGGQNSYLYKVEKAKSLLDPYIQRAYEEPGVFLSDPQGSRHKIKLVVSGTLAEPKFGIVDNSGQFTTLEKCPIHDPTINALLPSIKQIIIKYALTIYDIKKKQGELKAILISSNYDSSQIILRLVLRSTNLLEKAKSALNDLESQHDSIKVTSINIQPIPHAILEGTEEILVSKNPFITERLNNISMCFDPKSFMQVTPQVSEQLYRSAAQWLREYTHSTVLDLYCGVGGFALHVANFSGNVTGIEASSTAIKCATTAAILNEFNNCKFVDEDLETYELSSNVDALIVNPPRRGLSQNVLSFIDKTNPKTIIYSSCNVVSLIENLKSLTSTYSIIKFKFFDMFPLTDHLECLVLLQENIK
jgi:23S rRNA (uracil747-C5)-methyltransferase